MKNTTLFVLLFCAGSLFAANPDNEAAQKQVALGQAEFKAGRITQSIAAFDKAAALDPAAQPQLWQRGIALYYAGKFNEARGQFELRQRASPGDVENAAWHYLCIAATENVDAADKALLPIDTAKDVPVPMKQVYEMFAGRMTPEQVLAAVPDAGQSHALDLFQAQFYVALWHEAHGNAAESKRWMTEAAKRADVAGFMGDVARVHLMRLLLGSGTPKAAPGQRPTGPARNDVSFARDFFVAYAQSGEPWSPTDFVYISAAGGMTRISSELAKVEDRYERKWRIATFELSADDVANVRKTVCDSGYLKLGVKYEKPELPEPAYEPMTEVVTIRASGLTKSVTCDNTPPREFRKVTDAIDTEASDHAHQSRFREISEEDAKAKIQELTKTDRAF